MEWLVEFGIISNPNNDLLITIFLIYTQNPIVISIDSKDVAKAHIEQFKMFWNNTDKK